MSFFDSFSQDQSRETGQKLYAALRAQGVSPQDAWQQTNAALSQLGLTAMSPPQEVIDARNATGGNTSEYDPTTGKLLPLGTTKDSSPYAAGSGGTFPKMNATDAQYVVDHADQYSPTQVSTARALLSQTSQLTGDGGGVGQNMGLSQTDPAKYKMMQMHLGALGLQAQRPMMEQSRLNALQQQLNAYKPLNNAMTSMYGPGSGFNLQAQSPLVPGQTQVGAPNVGDIGLKNPAQNPELLKLLNGQ